MTDNETAPPLRITGPADLLQAVPYLLGFHPAASLVLVGLADTRLVVTARVDLADLAEPGVLDDAIEAMCRGGTDHVVAAIYDESDDVGAGTLPWRGLVRVLGDECDRRGCLLGDVLRVVGGRWWSYLCAASDCCPPEGSELPRAPSPFIAAATYAGLVALPDRASLAATLEPLPDADRERLEPLIADRENESVQAITSGRGHRAARSVKREIFAAARVAGQPGLVQGIGALPVISDRDVARFGAALSSTGIRDSVWMAVDAGRLDGRQLWRELARRLPSPYDAPPLFLYGWTSWRAGNGALAAIAVQRAIDSDPEYSAADLLGAALSHGLDPRAFPRVRLPRTA